MSIYKKLHEIQKQVSHLSKDSKSHNYTYVSGSKVLEAIKPLMERYGLILKQEAVSIENTRQDYKTKYGEKSEILTKVMMRFTWIDIETGDKDVNEFGANGQNDWEKGLGSALTYGERYFLLKYFHISTDEDDVDNPNRKAEAKQPEQPKTPVMWLNEKQLEKALNSDKEIMQKTLDFYDGKTKRVDETKGIEYIASMKKEFKEQITSKLN